MQSQNDIILAHMQKGMAINPMLALNAYGIMRLASRICELKKKGHKIGVEPRENLDTGARWAEYFLVNELANSNR